MKKSLIETFNQYKPEDICWYPCASLDLTNISLWKKEYGNNLKPKLFVFSDIDYLIDVTTNTISSCNNKNVFYDFNNEKYELLQLEENYFLEDLPTDQDYRNLGEKLSQNNPNLYKQFIQEKYYRDVDLNEDGTSTIYDMGFLDDENWLSEFYINHINKIQINGLKVEYDGVYIVFIKCKNQNLFNYFITQNLAINCFMTNRANDDVWLINEFDYNSVYIRELIGSEKYLPKLKIEDFQHHQGSFNWIDDNNNIPDSNNYVWKRSS